METNCPETSNEISLYEIIETLLKGKIIIIAIVVIAIVLSGIYSIFFTSDSYESNTVLMAKPIEFNQTSFGEDGGNMIDYLTLMPTMTLQTYLAQALSDDVIKDAIVTLDLRDETGNYIPVLSLRNRLTAEIVKDTNLIEIKATHQDPKMAADIANTVAASFIGFVTENTRRINNQTIELINQQLELEEQNLYEKSQALAEYWQNNENIDLLKAEVEFLKSKMTAAQSELIELDKNIAIYSDTLRSYQDLIQATPGLNPDDFFLELDLQSQTATPKVQVDLTGDDLSVTLMQLEISHLQNGLIQSDSRRTVLNEQVVELESQLVDSQVRLTNAEIAFNSLSREKDLAEGAYQAYQQKYKEALLTAASDIGKNSVIISSAANVPEAPTGSGRMTTIAIAAVLGLMLGAFIVLFRDYWKKSKPKKAT